MLLLLLLSSVGAPPVEPPAPAPVEVQATPGYPTRSGYRVRVGKRWMQVDPLDPLTLKAVYDAAEREAQRQAAQASDAKPESIAKRQVDVRPQGVDYAALAADAAAIQRQIRDVYAQAMQREMIARLMREQMERADEDDVELLLAVL